ncbi:fibrobacter succinogenes major paralogous domain-containing protein [uncultured Fibrobacter sp.]|uniref:fibrobacter succinogenes major paralogous domain-containing protein n=1 Tax=uncultured Fibrobacter sp. TaxID=261512 RepID=UPI0025DAB76E|nr:fibrobacter succinogenes major paralogous domain-containing protein [uncultured Fibrobacter sp.]
MRNLIKICTKSHSERSHAVTKSKNLLSPWSRKAAIGSIVFGVLLIACGEDSKTAGGTEEDAGVIAIENKIVSGVSQKGPFVNGSSVTVQELDGGSLAQTGNSYEGKIKNDMGEFSVKVAKLSSQYALLKANGFYRNEVTGEKSKSQITLYALTDLSNRDEVNVNLLTHMEYERSLFLASESLSVAKAKKQAESEVLASFEIEGDFATAEDLSIFGTNEGAAALLAVSVLMQGDLNEADFSERLANYAADIEQDGKWDDSKMATVIADWASNRSLTGTLAGVRKNIAGWGFSADVPAFEKYVNRFWWRVYSLGFCDKDCEGEVKAAENALSRNNGVHFICDDGAWRKATDVEYDTYEKKCDEDGKIVFGNVNKERAYECDGKIWRKATEVEGVLGGCVESRFDEVAEALESHYICESRQWRVATDIEKDAYKWKLGKDGDVKKGDVVKENCYVFENSVWRSGDKTDCTLNLRGCTALRQDTVGKGSDGAWYICDAQTWRKATIYEKDTFGWKDSTDGAIKKGNVTDSIYAFDETAWRAASNVEAKLGGCVSAIADSVGKVGTTYYICKSNKWVEANALEYDTYHWIAGKEADSKLGSVNSENCYVFEEKVWRVGNTNDCSLELRGCTKLRQDMVGLGSDKVWHICDTKSWRNATTSEKDTFGWKDSTDGVIKKGLVTDSVYKYDEISNQWILATHNDTTLKLMGCTAKRMGEIDKSPTDGIYYLCKNMDWFVAQEVEYDTYGEKCTNVNVGKIIAGKVTATNMYYCMANGWVSLMVWDWDVPKEARLNQEITYGTITDNRDGKNYRTVTIGDQTWMAENLNYADSIKTSSLRGKSWCYNNELKNCEVAGRLYTWAAAIDSVKLATDADNPLDCGSGKTCGLSGMVQGICPSGWHLPDTTEWNVLFLAVGGTPTAGKVLKSQTGWPNNGNGTDSFGFSALPTGYRNYTGSFEIDSGIAFWSSTENNTFNWTSHEMCIIDREDSFLLYTNNNVGLSIRCVKDSV